MATGTLKASNGWLAFERRYRCRSPLHTIPVLTPKNVFARHARHGEATRRAVRAWGLELLCVKPEECSNTLTAVLMPDGHDADRFRAVTLDRFNMSLGAGLGKLKGRVFRIGHLGDFNDLMLAGTLSGVENPV